MENNSLPTQPLTIQQIGPLIFGSVLALFGIVVMAVGLYLFVVQPEFGGQSDADRVMVKGLLCGVFGFLITLIGGIIAFDDRSKSSSEPDEETEKS